MRLTSKVCLCAAVSILCTPAFAQLNGLKANPYVFDDFAASTLTITNSNSIPGNVTIDDRDMTPRDPIGGANRHDVLLSSDNGATARNFSIAEGFTISTDLTLTAGTNAPRKEAGLRINSPVTGDALFIVNSDAGEIVAFGGPFYSFGSNGGGNGYTPGTTITMGMTYHPGSPGTLEYFIDRTPGVAGGESSSGPLPWTNLEGGPVNYQVAMYGQVTPGSTGDFITAQFNNVNASIVPEPTALGLAGIGALALVRRRR